jgi:phage FluMu gp28-like protein
MQTIAIELPKPHEGQRNVLESKARFRVLMCGRRWGKSLISKQYTITEALAGNINAYITPTYSLAKVFFDEIAKLIPNEVATANKSDLVFKFVTGGEIRFFTGERLDNLRGLKFHNVIIDEACYISNLEDAWNNAIRPTLTDYQGRALFISTPRGKDFFYRLYLRNGDKDFQSFKYTTYDNPFINNQEIDDAKASLPSAVFEQEYLANPMENAANPFGMDFIRANIQTLSENKPICYGIDVAKSYDYTVIIGLDANGSVCHYERFQADWNATKEKIKQLDKVPKVIDATGVGDPIVEDLQRDDYMIEGFKFTSTSKQQLIEGLVLAIQQGLVKYPDGTIVDELSLFEYVYTNRGVKYSAPDGMHDDAVCSLALAWRGFAQGRTLGQYALI